MFPSRKKLRVQIPPSDNQLWAIGVVVVKWTYVEQLIKVFVHSFTDENNPNDPIRKEFDSTRSMQMRVDHWEKLAQERIRPEWRAQMLALINETRLLQDQRDKIVHGTWAGRDGEADGPFNWAKPGHDFSWALDFSGLMKVVMRIDHHQYAMMELAFQAYGARPETDFTIGTALRRIQISS